MLVFFICKSMHVWRCVKCLLIYSFKRSEKSLIAAISFGMTVYLNIEAACSNFHSCYIFYKLRVKHSIFPAN